MSQINLQNIDWTSVLAVWGAIVATALAIKDIYVFYQNRQKEEREVKVRCFFNTYTLDPEKDGRIGIGMKREKQTLVVYATNTGYRQVQIKSAGFRTKEGALRNASTYRVYDFPFPKTLTDGEGIEVKFDYESVRHGPILQSAYVRDAEDNIYEGNLPVGINWKTEEESVTEI